MASKYASAAPFFGASPNWVVSNEDANRIRAYELYEDMYWNAPETFQLVQRGDDSRPVYLPSARKIIEATNRFLAVDFDFVTKPNSPAITNAFKALFKREKFFSKFAAYRRHLLMRGDAIWHITADPRKPAGQRISIHNLSPSSYFPIQAKDDLARGQSATSGVDEATFGADRVVGCHIVDVVPDPRDNTKVVNRRQTYCKQPNGTVTSELTLWELGKWDDRNLEEDKLKKVPWSGEVPEFVLPGITSLPVYPAQNQAAPEDLFGSSEIRGIESLFAAVNQSASDEDITLAMQGLGVYWSDAGPPVDADGNEGVFEIGPGQVADVPPGYKLGRVNGVSSVAPFLDHMNFLLSEAQSGLGVPDIAAGKVDVAVAESGISLQMQLSPLLDKNAEKELEIIALHDQMFHDLATQWMPQFESISAPDNVEVVATCGDPMPVNRQQRVQEILSLLQSTPPVITLEMATQELQKLGYDYPSQALAELKQQQTQLNSPGIIDPFGNRLDAEFGNSVQSAQNAATNGTGTFSP